MISKLSQRFPRDDVMQLKVDLDIDMVSAKSNAERQMRQFTVDDVQQPKLPRV